MLFLAAAGLVMVLFGLGAYYATDELSTFSVANLALGAVLLLGAAVAQSRRIQEFSGAMSRRVATRWTVILAATAAVVVLANAAVSGWSTLFDLTSVGEDGSGFCDLSPQSLDVLSELGRIEGHTARLVLLRDAPLAEEAQVLVRCYRAASDRLQILEVRRDQAPPEILPFLAYEPALVPCLGSRCEPLGYPSEGELTTAFVRLLTPEQSRAYFLLGHGEVDLGDESDSGYALMRDVLEAEGIRPVGWVGPAREDAPEDADLVIVAAPERDLLVAELDALDRYLEGGGRLLALSEPGTSTNLDALLQKWGFGLSGGIVADQATSPLLREPRRVSLVVNNFYSDHDVTRRFSSRTMMLLPTSRQVRAARKPRPEDRLRELVFSSPYSWVEPDIDAALHGRAAGPPKGQTTHELPIAAAGRYPRDGGDARIVVIGDRDFASNRLIHTLYNRDLLMNAVHWLLDRPERVTVRDKIWTPRQDPLTIQETLSFFYFFAFALPEVLLLLGLYAWSRQRV